MRVAEVPVFVDTNVLVHAFDQSAGNKRNRARTLLDQLWLDLRGHLSVQVLQKFFVVGIQRVRRPLAGIS